MGKKSTNAETAQRVEAVLRVVLDGAQFHDIVAFAAEQSWGVTDRQVREYVRRADALLVERRERNRQRLLARHVARREALFARAINAADYRTALAILDSMAKLQGLCVDARELKELMRLAASQNERLRELEARNATAHRHQEATPPTGAPDGPSGGPDPGGGGPGGPLPGEPAASDAGRGVHP